MAVPDGAATVAGGAADGASGQPSWVWLATILNVRGKIKFEKSIRIDPKQSQSYLEDISVSFLLHGAFLVPPGVCRPGLCLSILSHD